MELFWQNINIINYYAYCILYLTSILGNTKRIFGFKRKAFFSHETQMQTHARSARFSEAVKIGTQMCLQHICFVPI